MLARFWSFITGYVVLDVEGKNLEKLLNMIVGRGLYLWDIIWLKPDKIRLCIRVNGVRPMRHICRRTKCRFKIIRKCGLPFPVARLRKRKMLLGGAIISMALIYFMTSFIWFVEITGNKKIPTEQVISIAEKGGLSTGTMKSELDKDKVEKFIRSQIPEVAWVGIQITGTKALIEIAEKTIVPPPDTSPANLIADKDGLIEEILVLAGKPVVFEGDMVKRGDVLISGIVSPNQAKPGETGAAPENVTPGPVTKVRAKGIVRARIWYDGYGECPLVEAGTKRTGRYAEALSIKILGKELVLKGAKKPRFEDYTTVEKVKMLPKWRNINIPVEIITTQHYEVKKYRDIIGLSQARSKALEMAQENARSKIPPGAKVLREITEDIPARGGNVIRAKQLVEVLEDIGRPEPLKQEKASAR